MLEEHLYIVTYDISDDKRWRRIFRMMHGYCEWMQLSVFQCRLTRTRHVQLMEQLGELIRMSEDHVVIIDVAPADSVQPRVNSLGKRSFEGIERAPVIV